MKIAQVVCVLPPYGGGIGNVAHQYAIELVKLGHQVDVFVPKRQQYDNFHYLYNIIPIRACFYIGLSAFLPQLMWRLKNYDIVHLHLPFFGAAYFVYLAKNLMKNKFKLVVSYHMDVIGTGLKKKIFSIYNKYVLPKIIKSADKIIISSVDYIQESKISEYYFKYQSQFQEIPFGVSEKFKLLPKRGDLIKKYQIKPTDFIVGFVGGLDSAHYFKGVNILITAISKINNPNVKALIVGEGNLKKDYQALAIQLNIEKRIIFAGYVKEEELPDHYNLFDIFILPSIDKSEAFGLVILEAMACGRPIIASYLKGVRTTFNQGEQGFFVEPQNPKDIADKINILITNPKLRRQFSSNGLKLVWKKYRWPLIVKKLESVYLEVLKKKI